MMMLVDGSRADRRRPAAKVAAARILGLLAVALTVFAPGALLTGCGGGDGGTDTRPTPTPPAGLRATIVGSVVQSPLDLNPPPGVSGATVTFTPDGGGQAISTTTNAQGGFTLSVAPGTRGVLRIQPVAGLRDTVRGSIGGSSVCGSASNGITLNANQLTAGGTLNVGTLTLFSTQAPPEPPCI